MLQSEFKFQIEKLNELRCKAYFNDTTRTPIIGRFVVLDDNEHLFQRDLVRFVSDKNYESFEYGRNEQFTRMYMISKFSLIKPV